MTSKLRFLALAIAGAISLACSQAGAQSNPGRPASGTIQIGQSAALPLWLVPSQDCTITAAAVVTCLKTNNVSFAALATLGIGTGLSSGGGNLNIANTIVAGGPTGSATVAPILTWNAQGQLTVVSSATITPAFSSITGTPTTLSGYGITSPLPLAQGGVGIGSGTSGGIPYFSSTSAVASSAALGAGLVVVGGGPGAAPATIANGQHPGTATNDSASAGNIGEFISSTVLVGSAVGLTTNTDANVTSISLTAGDWDVSVNAYFTGTGTTTVSFVAGSATTTSAARDTNPGRLCQLSYNTGTTIFAGSGAVSCVVGPTRFSLSGTTTVFFTGTCTFGASTCSAYGIIRARRMR
jgi:hypothetical protein